MLKLPRYEVLIATGISRLGPYRNNEEERKMVFDAEVSTPLVGVGAGLEFGVYKKTDEKDNHGKKDP